MSVDYSLRLCYGVIIPEEVINKMYEVLEDFDDFYDNFINQIDSWTDEDWFIGVSKCINSDGDTFVQEVNKDFFEITKNPSILGNLEKFSQFYDEHNLNEYFDWKPKLYLINFCY